MLTSKHTKDTYLKTENYRPDIDALRAFAVLTVVINHFDKKLLPSGYLGVDVFFVISGYVITSSLHGGTFHSFTTFIGSFYTRRIKRLFPALVVYVFVTSFLICAFNPQPQEGLKTGLLSLFACSNHYLYHLSTDYFSQSTLLNPFTHTWSLGVEEQFYIVYPILFWFSGFSEVGRQRRLALYVDFAVVCGFALSITGFVTLYETDHSAAYFLMPTRFWEFTTGIFAYKIASIRRRTNSPYSSYYMRSFPLLLVIIMFGMMYTARSTTQALPATIGVVFLAGIFCCVECSEPPILLTNNMMVGIGRASYSLYLYHWGVLSLNRWTNISPSLSYKLPVTAVLTYFATKSSYRWIETPSRYHQGTQLFTLISAVIGLLSTTFFIILLYSSSFFRASLLAVGENTVLPQARNTGQHSVLLKPLPNGGFDKDLFSRWINQTTIFNPDGDYCVAVSDPDTWGSECIADENPQNRHVYIIGDSHACNHYPSVKGATVDLHANIEVKVVLADWLTWFYTTKGKCGKDLSCSDLESKVFTAIPIHHGDVVIVSFWRRHGVTSAFKERVNELHSRVTSSGGKLILVDDIPDVCTAVENFYHTVIRLGQFHQCAVTEAASLETRAVFTNTYKEVSSSDPENVLYYDPHPALCADGICDVFDRRENTPTALLYTDHMGHFRGDYPNPLQSDWKEVFKKIL